MDITIVESTPSGCHFPFLKSVTTRAIVSAEAYRRDRLRPEVGQPKLLDGQCKRSQSVRRDANPLVVAALQFGRNPAMEEERLRFALSPGQTGGAVGDDPQTVVLLLGRRSHSESSGGFKPG
jgi:hypothetical protein